MYRYSTAEFWPNFGSTRLPKIGATDTFWLWDPSDLLARASYRTPLPHGTHRLCFKAAPTSACPAHARDLVDCVSSLWYPGCWSRSSPTRAAPSYTRAACRDSWCVGWWNLGAAGGLDCGRWAAPRAEGSGCMAAVVRASSIRSILSSCRRSWAVARRLAIRIVLGRLAPRSSIRPASLSSARLRGLDFPSRHIRSRVVSVASSVPTPGGGRSFDAPLILRQIGARGRLLDSCTRCSHGSARIQLSRAVL